MMCFCVNQAVNVTACGNFGIAAASTGVIHMYNMQSGILRRTFDVGPCPANVSKTLRPADRKNNERCVTGLATDALDRILVVGTLDGTINVRCSRRLPIPPYLTSIEFFDFHTAELEHTLVLPSSVTSIILHRDNNLLAVVCEDLVRVVDIETRRVVRELSGFRGKVLDLVCCFCLFVICYSFR